MEVKITFPMQPTTPRTLKINSKIGEGKFPVYHAYSPSQKAEYALKAFPKDAIGTRQYQKETIMYELTHINIIQSTPAKFNEDAKFHGVLTELAQYGDFFDLVVGNVLNSEIIIRTYFHQLVAGLEHIHSKEIAHLDLKLENLLMGTDFTLKIIDFDLAQRTTDKVLASAGTPGFRAPEIIDKTCKNYKAADIYSLGVMLYAFRAQDYPFREVETKDGNTVRVSLKHYSTFLRDNNSFWHMKTVLKKDSSFFSDDFKQLVNGMLQRDVSKRFTLEDIKRSRWYKGPVLNATSLKEEMKVRWQAYEANKKK